MTVTYQSVEEIMHDLKAIGANVTAKTAQKNKGLTGRSVLQAVCQAYETFRRDDVLPATYEIIYGHAWKPVKVDGLSAGAGQQVVELK